LSIFQLPAVELLEVLAHKETLSPFIDSSIDKVLFQTNRVLDTQLRIIFATLFTTAVLKF